MAADPIQSVASRSVQASQLAQNGSDVEGINPQHGPSFDRAMIGPSAAATQPSQSVSPSTMDLTGETRRIEQNLQELLTKQADLNERVISDKLKVTDPQYSVESNGLFMQTLQLQTAAQRVSMGAELISKVVEHATSSTRTVLQTQA